MVVNLNENSQLTLKDRVLMSKDGVKDNKVRLSLQREREKRPSPKKEIKSKDSSKPTEVIKIYAMGSDNKEQSFSEPLKDIKNVNFSIDTEYLRDVVQMGSEKQYESDDEE